MKLLKILPVIFLLLIFSAKSFAAAPEISADQKYFNILKGHYVLKDNVRVALNNHGLQAIITADEARVNLFSKKCWATGKVNFAQDNINFSCQKAYLQWETKTADVVGAVKFDSKDTVSIKADSATFNWSEKIADFYGKVKVKSEKNLQLGEGVELSNTTYAHLKFNVRENKILQLEKNSDTPEISIPETEVEIEED